MLTPDLVNHRYLTFAWGLPSRLTRRPRLTQSVGSNHFLGVLAAR